ncbi:MAG: Crp/Fnr family transcriptional regulator [Steroidobacteraceae bacterium]
MAGRSSEIDTAARTSLRQHHLFSALTEAQWQALGPHMRRLRLTALQRLFMQGQKADAFFVVHCGSIKLFRESSSGLEKIVRLVKNEQSFAESVLFCEPPHYPVHAQAVTDTALFRIEREAYLAALRDSFDTCRAVMMQMVGRIYRQWDEIEALSLHGSHARVARYLYGLIPTGASAIRLPARKALIAVQLGLAPETLSRGLRSLAQQRVIAVHGRVIEILDPRGLCESAQR